MRFLAFVPSSDLFDLLPEAYKSQVVRLFTLDATIFCAEKNVLDLSTLKNIGLLGGEFTESIQDLEFDAVLFYNPFSLQKSVFILNSAMSVLMRAYEQTKRRDVRYVFFSESGASYAKENAMSCDGAYFYDITNTFKAHPSYLAWLFHTFTNRYVDLQCDL